MNTSPREPRMPDPLAPAPESIRDVDHLDDLLSTPTEAVVATFRRLPGDIMLLGVGGKMGPTLARMARRAADAAGTPRRIYGVARFSTPELPAWLERHGVEPIACDLLDDARREALPKAPNVVAMFGMKFGATGQASLTWAMNCFLPGLVAKTFRDSRIVAFSTGNVYGWTAPASGGSREGDPLAPIGEYAQTAVGRERIYDWASRAHGTPMAILRLNYAVEMRYGVLVDIGRKVLAGEPIDLRMGHLNAIWQGDANAMALQAFDCVESPPRVLNLAGPETLRVRDVAARFGELLEREPILVGEEAPDALLSNASESLRRFGPPRIGADQVLAWTADWLRRGGPLLDRPTRFEVRDGRY
jgi:nucleoside-diphosphate-sugar epimerase